MNSQMGQNDAKKMHHLIKNLQGSSLLQSEETEPVDWMKQIQLLNLANQIQQQQSTQSQSQQQLENISLNQQTNTMNPFQMLQQQQLQQLQAFQQYQLQKQAQINQNSMPQTSLMLPQTSQQTLQSGTMNVGQSINEEDEEEEKRQLLQYQLQQLQQQQLQQYLIQQQIQQAQARQLQLSNNDLNSNSLLTSFNAHTIPTLSTGGKDQMPLMSSFQLNMPLGPLGSMRRRREELMPSMESSMQKIKMTPEVIPVFSPWDLVHLEPTFDFSGVNMNISLYIRGESYQNWIPQRLYTSHKYHLNFSINNMPENLKSVRAVLSLVHEASQNKIEIENMVKSNTSLHPSFKPSNTNNTKAIQCETRFQLLKSSYKMPKDEKAMQFHIDIVHEHKKTLFSIRSPPFEVFARKNEVEILPARPLPPLQVTKKNVKSVHKIDKEEDTTTLIDERPTKVKKLNSDVFSEPDDFLAFLGN